MNRNGKFLAQHGPWLRLMYLQLLKSEPRYTAFTFNKRRREMAREDLSTWEESSGSLVYSVQQFLAHAQLFREGKMAAFSEFHRPGSLVNFLKLHLHRPGYAADLGTRDPGLDSLIRLAGAAPLTFSDGCLLSLLDHLVLISEAGLGGPAPELRVGIQAEALRRAELGWSMEKALRVVDALLRAAADLGAVGPASAMLLRKAVRHRRNLRRLSSEQLVLLAAHGAALDAAPGLGSLLGELGRRLGPRPWGLSSEELCVLAAAAVAHRRRVGDGKLARELGRLAASRAPKLSRHSQHILDEFRTLQAESPVISDP